MMNKRIMTFLMVSLAIAALVSVHSYPAKFKSGEDIIISEDTGDDIFISGETVTINGDIKGDAVIFAKDITLNGRITGDLMTGGENILINGIIGDDARIAGKTIKLGNKGGIEDDFIGAGYSFSTGKNSLIGGNVIFSGAQAILNGKIDSALRFYGDGLRLNGTIKGDVYADVGAPKSRSTPVFFRIWSSGVPAIKSGITAADTALIEGDFTYSCPKKIQLPDTLTKGKIEFKKEALQEETEEHKEEPTFISQILHNLKRLAALLIIGLLMLWAVPRWTESSINFSGDKPLASFGTGILATVALLLSFPAVIIAAAVPIIILYFLKFKLLALILTYGSLLVLGLIALLTILVLGYCSKILISAAAGKILLDFGVEGFSQSRFLSLISGLILFLIVTNIPYIGIPVYIIVVLTGMGAMTFGCLQFWKTES